jgi:recombinational DNA repair protein (RecF pathway)
MLPAQTFSTKQEFSTKYSELTEMIDKNIQDKSDLISALQHFKQHIHLWKLLHLFGFGPRLSPSWWCPCLSILWS